MALSINTNTLALNTQNQLGKSSNAMSTAMERLSSGLRINSAKDDAAGLAIADRFTAQIRGLNQAVRNANDGISLSQTAEGAMGEMSNILQRMRELAVQSINDTNTASDRLALQQEVDQLYDELDRIANTTQFNGQNILDGTLKTSTFQIGANAGQTLTVGLESVTTDKLGLNSYSALGDLNTGRVLADTNVTDLNAGTAIKKDDILINGENALAADVNFGTDASSSLTDVAENLADALNANSAKTGVKVTAYNTVSTAVLSDGTTLTAEINGVQVSSTSAEQLVDIINRDVADLTATLNSDNSITLSNDTGKDISIGAASGEENTLGVGNTTAGSSDTFTGFLSMESVDGTAISVTLNESSTNASVADIQTLGLNVSQADGTVQGSVVGTNALAASDDIVINGIEIGASDGGSASDMAAAINAVKDQSGVEATAYNEVTVSLDMTALESGQEALRVNGTEVSLASAVELDDVVSAINNSALNGVVATADEDGNLLLTSSTGQNITVGGTTELLVGVTALDGTSPTITSSTDTTGSYAVTLGYTTPAAGTSATYSIGDSSFTITAGQTAAEVKTTIDNLSISGLTTTVTQSGQLNLTSTSDFDISFTSGSSDALGIQNQGGTNLGTIDTGASATEVQALTFNVGTDSVTITLNDAETNAAEATSVADIASIINGDTNARALGISAVASGTNATDTLTVYSFSSEAVSVYGNTGAADVLSGVTATQAADAHEMVAGSPIGTIDSSSISTSVTDASVDSNGNAVYNLGVVGASAATSDVTFVLGDPTATEATDFTFTVDLTATTPTQVVADLNGDSQLAALGITAISSGSDATDTVSLVFDGTYSGELYAKAAGAGIFAGITAATDLVDLNFFAVTSGGDAQQATFEDAAVAAGRLTLENVALSGGEIRLSGDDLSKLGLVEQGGSEDVVGAGLSVSSAQNATIALGRIDDALEVIASARSSLGAVQNRFESTISNLSNVSQNLTSARGRILDADFASETTNLSKAQVLQQAGTAMLAQANASAQSVLSLLG